MYPVAPPAIIMSALVSSSVSSFSQRSPAPGHLMQRNKDHMTRPGRTRYPAVVRSNSMFVRHLPSRYLSPAARDPRYPASFIPSIVEYMQHVRCHPSLSGHPLRTLIIPLVVPWQRRISACSRCVLTTHRFSSHLSVRAAVRSAPCLTLIHLLWMLCLASAAAAHPTRPKSYVTWVL